MNGRDQMCISSIYSREIIESTENADDDGGFLLRPPASAAKGRDRFAINFAVSWSSFMELIRLDIHILAYFYNQAVLGFEVAGDQMTNLTLSDF